MITELPIYVFKVQALLPLSRSNKFNKSIFQITSSSVSISWVAFPNNSARTLHARFYVSLPCGNFPQKHDLRWRVLQWTLHHSTVRRAFSSAAPGDGLQLLRDLPMLTHYDLSYICNLEVMSVYVLRIFFFCKDCQDSHCFRQFKGALLGDNLQVRKRVPAMQLAVRWWPNHFWLFVGLQRILQ